ncbi:ACP phosphodiesterase [Dasania marina]|uniref:acyl carrier protein phosphodiesterase n=1 Tax=Dasania marina TaxID=471499 RepID=UPI0030D6DB2A|tara:strand:+ start:55963 stop:56532 length:570 start_codon:yes stop_codon:yes gene_type:complete
MNYLAHLHLSHDTPGLMIGALLGDVVKGPLKGEYPADWEQGIRLHRRIDAYTDSHALIRACQADFPKKFRRFSPIMLDVVFDHFLIKHWQQFHPQILATFSTEMYQFLSNTHWPAAAQPHVKRIVKHDLLNRYQEWDFIIEVIASIGLRMRVTNPLADTDEILAQHYQQIEGTFLQFYPQLQQHVNGMQ